MRKFLSGLLAYITYLIMCIPFWIIRRSYIKLIVKKLGRNTFVMRNVDLRAPKNISIGNNVMVNKRVLLDGRGKLVIGDNVDIAQDVQIWSQTHDINDENHATVGKPVKIEDYCWIGTRSIILPGITIRRGAVVGAGAVVTKNVDPLCVVAGNPAVVIGHRNNKLEYKLDYHPWFS